MATRKPIRSKPAAPKPAAPKLPAPKPPAAKPPAPKPEANKPAVLKPAAKPAEATPAKSKQKLVRDSFTIPKDEYVVLEQLKQRALRSGRAAKKSEILRAGIAVLNAMSDSVLLAALSVVPNLKTGRPKAEKHKAASKPSKKE